MPGMLLHEGDRFLDGLHGEGVDLDRIQDAAVVAAGEAPGLDPGIWKGPLTSRRVSRSLRLRARKGVNDSEVARKTMASDPSPGKGCSSKPSPREKRRSSSNSSASARRLVQPPHVHACGRALANQVMGSARAGVRLQGELLRLPPGQDLDLRYEPIRSAGCRRPCWRKPQSFSTPYPARTDHA